MPLRTKELPNVGGPASFVLLSSRSAPVLPLRLYCLSIVCPLGLPGSAPARMLQGDSSKTFSVFPTHTVWTIPTPQCLSLEHPRTCPTEPYGLALTLRLCTCTWAVPAQTCSAPSGLVAFWFTVMCPHCLSRPGPSTWPSAAICKHFGLLTVFLHAWEAPATSQAFLASVNPEEDQPPSFPEGRMTPFSILSAKQKESATESVSEVKAWVGHLRMDWEFTEALAIPGRGSTGCCSKIRRVVISRLFT